MSRGVGEWELFPPRDIFPSTSSDQLSRPRMLPGAWRLWGAPREAPGRARARGAGQDTRVRRVGSGGRVPMRVTGEERGVGLT